MGSKFRPLKTLSSLSSLFLKDCGQACKMLELISDLVVHCFVRFVAPLAFYNYAGNCPRNDYTRKGLREFWTLLSSSFVLALSAVLKIDICEKNTQPSWVC
jgi:hypothetical protein